MTANEVIQYMESLRNEEQRIGLMRFFKTGKGEYGEGDEFLGLKVPETREVVKYAKDVPFESLSRDSSVRIPPARQKVRGTGDKKENE